MKSIINNSLFGFIIMIVMFLISGCSNKGTKQKLDFPKVYTVNLPQKIAEMPNPQQGGENNCFKFRGMKGWGWDPEQYIEEIPFLAKYKMNFLMNCYLTMYDVKNKEWYDMFRTDTNRLKSCNHWWKPLSAEKKKSFEEIVRKCKEYNINFCFSMNPNLFSERVLKYDSKKDFEDLCQHFDWMQGLGVKWFNISLDDINKEIDAKGQAMFVNKLLAHLRQKDKDAEMIFTPTHYTGVLDNDPYTEILAKELDKDVYIFWVGIDVPSTTITTADAEKYKKNINHRIFIWDNYPVNDAHLTMHLGPVVKRDADLYKVVDGFMGNSMCRENEIQRIPVMTMADYTYNPEKYNPDTSIGQAILHLSENKEEQAILKELVELYPGMLIVPARTNSNYMLDRFKDILKDANNKDKAEMYLNYLKDFQERFNKAFPDKFRDAAETLEKNIETMTHLYKETFKS